MTCFHGALVVPLVAHIPKYHRANKHKGQSKVHVLPKSTTEAGTLDL